MDELLSLAGELVALAADDAKQLDGALAHGDQNAANCYAMAALARATTAQASILYGIADKLRKDGEL